MVDFAAEEVVVDEFDHELEGVDVEVVVVDDEDFVALVAVLADGEGFGLFEGKVGLFPFY